MLSLSQGSKRIAYSIPQQCNLCTQLRPILSRNPHFGSQFNSEIYSCLPTALRPGGRHRFGLYHCFIPSLLPFFLLSFIPSFLYSFPSFPSLPSLHLFVTLGSILLFVREHLQIDASYQNLYWGCLPISLTYIWPTFWHIFYIIYCFLPFSFVNQCNIGASYHNLSGWYYLATFWT